MEIIIITPECFLEGEGEAINQILSLGVDLVHVRKPLATERELASLLEKIPPELLGRIVLHDYFSLLQFFPVKGLHLNRRNPAPPSGYSGYLSTTCHSLAELAEKKPHFDRLFLSPIFNSLSKPGYLSAFTPDQLACARDSGLIDIRVCALGGVTLQRLSACFRLGFGGAALLGEPWAYFSESQELIQEDLGRSSFSDYLTGLLSVAHARN